MAIHIFFVKRSTRQEVTYQYRIIPNKRAGALAQKGGAFIKILTLNHKPNFYGGVFILCPQVWVNGGAIIRGGAFIRDHTVCCVWT